MSAPILRNCLTGRLTVANGSIAANAVLDYTRYGGGRVRKAAGSSLGTVALHEACSVAGPWTPSTKGGTAITLDLSSGNWIELPTELFAAAAIAFQGTGSAGDLEFSLKS